MIKPALKRLAYRSKVLEGYHRLKNRDQLTVVMVHRVLAATDARAPGADPDYTISDRLFADCVDFFAAHYNVVGLDELLAAASGLGELPPWPFLLTFDDGWADNVEYALPILQAKKVPAVMFVAADAVGRTAPFWQEQLIGAVREGRLDLGEDVRKAIARLESLSDAEREAKLAPLAPRLAPPAGQRHMITAGELDTLRAGRVAIGAHGKSHRPIEKLTPADYDAELAGARAALGPDVVTLSFPHGRYDDAAVSRARASGYRLLFTSQPFLNPVARDQIPPVLGRMGFTAEGVTDAQGAFCPELMALWLFRRPSRRLD